MNYEYLFLFSMFLVDIIFCWNLSLLDSRYYWRKKWNKQLKEIERLENELQVQIEDNVRLNEYIEELENKGENKND